MTGAQATQTGSTPEDGSEAARPLRLPVLFASFIAIGVGMGLWFAIFGAVVFAGAYLYDGMEGFNRLVSNFERFDLALLGSDNVAQRVLFAAGALIYVSALASIVTVALVIGRARAFDLLGWRGAWPRITRTGWILIALAPVYHILAGALLRYFFPNFALWLIPPKDIGALALSFLMIVVLAPLTEELLFRGWIFGALRARFSARFTVLATAFLFAIVHWDQTGLYPVAVLAPGFVLSVIRERTDSVKPAVMAHAIYNLIGWLLLVLAGLLSLQ
ncbi:MAG: lysostaphin resistance A-like protein [Beijerinckiaceae bacterium]